MGIGLPRAKRGFECLWREVNRRVLCGAFPGGNWSLMVRLLGLVGIGTAPECTLRLGSPTGKLCRGVMSGIEDVGIMRRPGAEQGGPHSAIRCERRSALG